MSVSEQRNSLEIARELKIFHGKQLANAAAGAFDSFASEIIGSIVNRLKSVNDPDLQHKQQCYEDASDALTAFLDSPNLTTYVGPRKVRESDRVTPGQHGGVLIQLQDQSGVILRINAYGGIRDSQSVAEMRDSKYAHTHNNIHADRTDDIRSQKRHINMQMAVNPQDNPFMEIWMKIEDKEICLSTFTYNKQNLLTPTKIPSTDKRYQDAVPKLSAALTALAQLVDNPYSPR